MSDHKRQRVAGPGEFPRDPDFHGGPDMGVHEFGPDFTGGMAGMGMGGGMGVGMGMGPGPAPLGMSMAGYEKIFPCVKLRGLPFDVTDDDIRIFLVEMAMGKNKTYMGKRYVEVFKAKKLDYYKAVVSTMTDADFMNSGGRPSYGGGQSQVGGGGGGGYRPVSHNLFEDGVLKLRGLPFSATKQDIAAWFMDSELRLHPVPMSCVHIVTDMDGRPSGQAFVEFSTTEDAQAAMVKDRHMMGNRYIELFPVSREEAERTITNYGRR